MEDEAGIFGRGFRRDSLALKMADIAMRLPPVFMMDALLIHNMGVSLDSSLSAVQPLDGVNITEHITNSTDLYQTFSALYGGNPALLIIPHILRFLGCLFLYALSMFVFFLPSECLVVFYRYLLCAAAIPISFSGHKLMLDSGQDGNIIASFLDSNISASLLSLSVNYRFITSIVVNYFLQSSLAGILQRLLRPESSRLSDSLPLTMVTPVLLAPWLPAPLLLFSAFLASVPPAAALGISLGQQLHPMVRAVSQMINTKRENINNFGLNTFIESEWVRLRVPTVLRYFWLSRMTLLFIMTPAPMMGADISLVTGLECIKRLLVTGSDTVVTVLGMTSVVSTLSHWLGLVFQLVLAAEHEDDKSVASVSAVLFFVLALQTGLTGMESEKRFQQICKNLCLLVTAILHFVHSTVQPVLMSISASRSNNRSSHIRALSICLFLILAPTSMIFILWHHFNMGTWLLAVTAFCIEVVVKVLVTVIIYGLFMWDSHCQDGLWESLDDWVYYIRAAGNTVEFFFAVFLFFNGGWILLFESGGTIRACMMLIHAYFNIWCEARNGWTAFNKRRSAVAKINSLSDATEEEIRKHNDVCAICYQDMTSAKITRCRHMFHAICLRKWLYMQDNCPMCHEKLYRIDATSQTEFQQDLPENQNVIVAQGINEADVNADNNNQENGIEE